MITDHIEFIWLLYVIKCLVLNFIFNVKMLDSKQIFYAARLVTFPLLREHESFGVFFFPLNDQQNKIQSIFFALEVSLFKIKWGILNWFCYTIIALSFSSSNHILPITNPISLQMSMLSSVINLKTYWMEVQNRKRMRM